MEYLPTAVALLQIFFNIKKKKFVPNQAYVTYFFATKFDLLAECEEKKFIGHRIACVPINSNVLNMSASIMSLLLCLLVLFSPLQCLTSSEWGTSGGYTDEYESYTTAYINITYRDAFGRLHSDKSEIGKFGEAHVGYAVGILVHVKNQVTGDASGCHLPLKPSHGRQFPRGEPWIALVKRGGCNFQIKVNNAAAMNATGIIVYNDRESNNLDKMKLAKSAQSRKSLSVLSRN